MHPDLAMTGDLSGVPPVPTDITDMFSRAFLVLSELRHWCVAVTRRGSLSLFECRMEKCKKRLQCFCFLMLCTAQVVRRERLAGESSNVPGNCRMSDLLLLAPQRSSLALRLAGHPKSFSSRVATARLQEDRSEASRPTKSK